MPLESAALGGARNPRKRGSARSAPGLLHGGKASPAPNIQPAGAAGGGKNQGHGVVLRNILEQRMPPGKAIEDGEPEVDLTPSKAQGKI